MQKTEQELCNELMNKEHKFEAVYNILCPNSGDKSEVQHNHSSAKENIELIKQKSGNKEVKERRYFYQLDNSSASSCSNRYKSYPLQEKNHEYSGTKTLGHSLMGIQKAHNVKRRDSGLEDFDPQEFGTRAERKRYESENNLKKYPEFYSKPNDANLCARNSVPGFDQTGNQSKRHRSENRE